MGSIERSNFWLRHPAWPACEGLYLESGSGLIDRCCLLSASTSVGHRCACAVPKLVDLELEDPALNERAALQVKSVAGQKTLDAYIRWMDAAEQCDRFFFICHSPKGALSAPIGIHSA